MTPIRLYLRCLRWGLAAGAAGAVLFAAFVEGGTSYVSDSVPYVLVPTLCVFLVLWPAVGAIARGWAGRDQPASSPLSGRPNGSW